MSPTLEMDTPTRPTSLRASGASASAHLRRQVKGDRQPRLPLGEEVVEPPIRLGRSEPGILPHGPEARPVHRWLDPPRVGIPPGSPGRRGSRSLRGRPAARRGTGAPQEVSSPARSGVRSTAGRKRLPLPARQGVIQPGRARWAAAIGAGPGRRTHSGRFPCFRGRFWSRFVERVSSAEMSRRRVSRGSMTSST